MRTVILTISLLMLPGISIANEMLEIPGGTYLIGDNSGRYDEKPAFKADLGAFKIHKFEVSNQQFQEFLVASGYEPQGPWRRGLRSGDENKPVRFVTWDDANAFCKFHGQRLPTETEWESVRSTSQGTGIVGLEIEHGPVTVVQNADANKQGVMGLVGNVREWTADWYDKRIYATYGGKAVAPEGPADGTPPEDRFIRTISKGAGEERSTRKVVRGGSWVSNTQAMVSKSRRWAHGPKSWYDDIGFRCAR